MLQQRGRHRAAANIGRADSDDGGGSGHEAGKERTPFGSKCKIGLTRKIIRDGGEVPAAFDGGTRFFSKREARGEDERRAEARSRLRYWWSG